MKKLIPLLLALTLLLSGCGRGKSVTSGHARSVRSCGSYTQREIDAAMDAAERYFRSGFESCTLLDIRYDGDSAAKAEAEWAEQYGADRAMVLESDFRTGQGNLTLNPNRIYRNWSWIMVWERGRWEVKTCGYG